MSGTYVDSTQAISASSPVVVAVPAGVSNGDRMLMVACCGYTSGSPRLTTPTGWTKVPGAEGTSTLHHVCIYEREASSEPANYSVSATGTLTGIAAAIVAVSDTPNPIIITNSWDTGSTSGSMIAPSIDLPDDSLVLIMGGHVSAATRTLTPPSGFTEDEDTGSIVGIYIAHASLTAGATGSKTATASNTLSRWGAGLFAVRSPVAGGDTLFNSHNF